MCSQQTIHIQTNPDDGCAHGVALTHQFLGVNDIIAAYQREKRLCAPRERVGPAIQLEKAAEEAVCD